jgi:hypothetical protein
MLMKFKEYAENKFMATNCPIEVDIIVCPLFEKEICADGSGIVYSVETANETNVFETWEKAVRFAEYRYGVCRVFEDTTSEDEYYDNLYQQQLDGYATLGGQV